MSEAQCALPRAIDEGDKAIAIIPVRLRPASTMRRQLEVVGVDDDLDAPRHITNTEPYAQVMWRGASLERSASQLLLECVVRHVPSRDRCPSMCRPAACDSCRHSQIIVARCRHVAWLSVCEHATAQCQCAVRCVCRLTSARCVSLSSSRFLHPFQSLREGRSFGGFWRQRAFSQSSSPCKTDQQLCVGHSPSRCRALPLYCRCVDVWVCLTRGRIAVAAVPLCAFRCATASRCWRR